MATEFDAENFHYPLIHGLLYNAPLMIDPAKADVLHNVLQGYALGTPPPLDAAGFRAETAQRKPYRVTNGGVAVIPVEGSLTHRAGWLDAMSGLTSYRRLHAALRAAGDDNEVLGVLLDVDSPGGSAAGLFELADHIRELSAVKPVWALANEAMFSAAYAIGAACSRILAPRTAMVGSIGVIMMHLDQSQADAKAGRVYTPIIAGAHKADGSPHAPLSDSALAGYQSLVDNTYQAFVEHVAAGRGISAEAVRATEAQVYHASDAKELGLVDEIVRGFDAVLDQFEAVLAAPRSSVSITRADARPLSEVNQMSDDITTGGNGAANEAALADARAAGVQQGRADADSRVASILALESAKGRIDPALSAVIAQGLTVEQADAVLSAAGQPAAQAGNGFAAAMSALGNPAVAESATGGAELSDADRAARAVSFIQ